MIGITHITYFYILPSNILTLCMAAVLTIVDSVRYKELEMPTGRKSPPIEQIPQSKLVPRKKDFTPSHWHYSPCLDLDDFSRVLLIDGGI